MILLNILQQDYDFVVISGVWKWCRQRIKLNVLMMPKDHMFLKALFKTKKLKIFKMDDQDSL